MSSRALCLLLAALTVHASVAAKTSSGVDMLRSQKKSLLSAAATRATDRASQLPQCQDIESGNCQCSNGDEKKNVRSMNNDCSLGKDDEGNRIDFDFFTWLNKKKHCPEIGTGAGKAAFKQAQVCFGDQKPCATLDLAALEEAFEKCDEDEVKEAEAEEEGGGKAEAEKKPVADTKMDRSMPEVKVAMSWNKDIAWGQGSPWDQQMSTPKSLSNALYGGSEKLGDATPGSAKGAVHFSLNDGGEVLTSPDDKPVPFGGARYLTSKEFEVSTGGVIQTYIRYGDAEGGEKCKHKVAAMLAEVARQRRCEAEVADKAECLATGAKLCNGHGVPIFQSGCTDGNGNWKGGNDNVGVAIQGKNVNCKKTPAEWNCRNDEFYQGKGYKCSKCKCETPYQGDRCSLPFKWTPRWSRSVGDPHPSTFNGVYTNLYDGGEFVWWRHPKIPVEVHLSSFPRGFVAVNAGMSLQRCKSVDANGKMQPPCEGVTNSGNQYTINADGSLSCNQLKYGCVYKTGNQLRTKACNAMSDFNAAEVVLVCGGGYYKNSYLRVKSLGDGTGYGVAGHWGGNDYAADMVSRSGVRGRHRMYTNLFYKKYRITDSKQSHFRCGGNAGRVRHHWASGFRETAAKVGTAAEMQAEAKSKVAAQEQALTKLWAREDVSNRRMRGMRGDGGGEIDGNVIASATAKKWCTDKIIECSKLQTPDKSALEGCIKDMVKIGNTADGKERTLKTACDLVKEDFETAIEGAVEDLKEVKQELAEAWPLLLPSTSDVVLQYCVKNCDPKSKVETDRNSMCVKMREDTNLAVQKNKKHPVREMNKACLNNGGGWQTMKTFSIEEYGDELQDKFKRFTTRIPEDAVAASKKIGGGKIRIRYYQHNHPVCFCCNPVAIDDIEVRTGGWPVRIIADDKFTVFADGKEVGSGQWAKRENSIDVNRFRISKETKVVGLLVEGTPKARGERDEHLKTGMTAVLGSIGGSLVTSATWSCTDKVGDAKWLKEASTEAFKKQADTWASAAELGDNQEPGVDPWGIIPGIAKSARWIFSHSTTKNANTKTYCRVDTRDAWHSYDMAHPSASRWSCANREHRMSAGVISLNADNSRVSFPTKEVATQNHRTTYKESTNGWAPLRTDDQQTLQMVLRANLGDIFDKTTEGAMIKVGYLRLYTAEAGVDGEICNLGANKKDAKALTDKWSQDDCTFERVEKNPKLECKKFKSVKNDFIRVDISDWVRGWRTDKTTNIGMLIGVKSGTLRIAATDYAAAAADLRPRLSLSCHGDQANPDAVFKERRTEMIVPDADAPADNVFIGSRLPKNFKATGWFNDKKELAQADREFSSSQ